jgi:competence protein CoiA
MHLIAKNSNGEIIVADRADKEASYFCLECNASVRLRGGARRRRHFYHTTQARPCRQAGKSATHLAVQQRLLSLLPFGEARLEVAFPEIGRIADLYWEKAKIVFEVQCSPISKQEVEERSSDYRRLGLTPVWILHANRYNRRRLTEAEEWLTSHPHYYTTIDETGKGLFFDQWSQISGGVRHQRSPKLTVELNCPKPTPERLERLPAPFDSWSTGRSIIFAGDLIDRVSGGASHLIEELATRNKIRPQGDLLQRLMRLYLIPFRALLEMVNDRPTH